MAGIILVKSSLVAGIAVDNAREKFKKKSFEVKEEKYIVGGYTLYYYYDFFEGASKIYKNPYGDYFFVIGTLVVEGRTGVEALKIIEDRLDRKQRIEDMSFSGSYILIFYRKGEIFISRDMFGGIDCYTNTANSWITTNFIAAASLNGSNRFSRNELLESLLFGFVFGDHTIIEGVYLLGTTQIFNLSSKSSTQKKIHIPSLERSLEKCLNNCLDILIHEFDGYNKAFCGNLVSALSGGFDTRLMLALMLEVGIVPDLYVYGSDNAKDVIVAKNLAQGEGYKLAHIDKQNYATISVSKFGRVVENNYYDLDLKSDIFTDQSDLETRMIRARTIGLIINGSGGGIYRDVWKWDFKQCSLYDIFRNSYNLGDLEDLDINVKEFFENIQKKMQNKLAQFFSFGDKLTRQQAEMIFPVYRSRFYAPSNTVSNYFGSATFPFMSEPVALQSFSVPHEFKRYGEFERLLIKKLNPKLAAYMSDYGFNFTTGPGFKKRFVERFYSVLSPEIKTKIKSMTGLSSKSLYSSQESTNPYLERVYLGQLIDSSEMVMNHYVRNVHKIRNRNVLNRLYSYEYFAKKEKVR